VSGSRHYNPGWHYAIDVGSMLVVCEAIIRSALNREESRGGHTRLDFPETEDALENINTLVRQQHDRMICEYVARPPVPEDLQKLL
jgi:succinate dehydrogenase / fumarate reductase flavoprotein subunit